ncbi:OmpA family protein [Niabella sp.]|uniref:OmpA family protein n=1 Tax=Niabella sp. TaxID=1962976 RepID=UPI00260580DC|nr:OmpA family protein [Niabella sp.]
MKRIIVILLALAVPFAGQTQDVLNKFKDKVKNRAEQRTDQAMDKVIDQAEAAIQEKPEATDRVHNDKKEAAAVRPDSEPGIAFRSYSTYDFVRGENVRYAEDFSQDVIGEFPIQWATNNRGETVTIEGLPNKWMRMFIGAFVSAEIKKLPENFTVEFDMLLTYVNNDEPDFGAGFPRFEWQLLQLAPGAESARLYAQGGNEVSKLSLIVQPAYEDRSSIYIQSYNEGAMYFEGGNKALKKFSNNYRKPFHVAIWVQKQRLRCWVNEEKIYDIPQAIAPRAAFNHLGFLMSDNSQEENTGVYVSNIRVAEGSPDMRSKLITEGKLVTSGILFDTGSDKIKPESAAVLKEIASILHENAALHVKINGYTDSDGDDVKNLELSKRRAAAVKNALTNAYKITASRMETGGFGEAQPVADNTTREGRAQNRRVEFIKL